MAVATALLLHVCVVSIGRVNDAARPQALQVRARPQALQVAAAAAAAQLYTPSFGYNGSFAGWEPNTSHWQVSQVLQALLEVEDAPAPLAARINATMADALRVHTAPYVLTEMAGAFDDLGWWTLFFLAAHARNASGASAVWLARARAVFDATYADAWETGTCEGGLWWSEKRFYKNAITNTLALDAAVQLAAATESTSASAHAAYAAQAKLIGSWLVRSGIVDANTSYVYDGLAQVDGPTVCAPSGISQREVWTYNMGKALDALVGYGDLIDDGGELLALAAALANATIDRFAAVAPDAPGDVAVLVELLGIHDRDQQIFKGVFCRSLARLVVTLRARGAHAAVAGKASAFLASSAALVAALRQRDGLFAADWRTAPPSADASNRCNSDGTAPGLGAPRRAPFPPIQVLQWKSCVGPTPQTSALYLLNAAAQVARA
jgi:predicted alpha-1,6-mannanase (GH76 family)